MNGFWYTWWTILCSLKKGHVEYFEKLFQHQYVPRSNSAVRKRPAPGNSGDFVEVVFRPEIFRIFPMISGRFLSESTGS
jgi:hypothetical protein